MRFSYVFLQISFSNKWNDLSLLLNLELQLLISEYMFLLLQITFPI